MNQQVIEPATERLIESVPRTPPGQVGEAVERAACAQREWWAAAPAERAAVLRAIGDAVDRDVDRLATLEARNAGMPIGEARGAVAGVAETFRFYASEPQRPSGRTIPVAGGVDMTFREPIGVVAAITPWNFPLSIAAWKLAPALAAGNGVVHKPSELTPLSALELGRIATEAGLPPGLLEIVVGSGADAGEALVRHPGIGKVAFTGSTEVGCRIAATAAAEVKRVSLELGGKSAAIIFADADLEAAARGLAGGAFGNAGQDCCARSRVFVEQPAVEDLLGFLADLVADLRVGNPLEDGTDMGPLISARQRSRVADYVGAAPVAFQGSAPSGPGFWFPPTVLHPIADDHPAAREEIFGPVLGVHPFEREEEAVARANDSVYGLAGSIWTRDGARALRVARRLQAGALAVNSYGSVRLGTPFGGFKQSGIGRELGADAADAYGEVKNIFVAT